MLKCIQKADRKIQLNQAFRVVLRRARVNKSVFIKNENQPTQTHHFRCIFFSSRIPFIVSLNYYQANSNRKLNETKLTGNDNVKNKTHTHKANAYATGYVAARGL